MATPYCPQQTFCSARKRSRVVDTLSGSTIRPSLPGCAHERLFDGDPRTRPHVSLITATMGDAVLRRVVRAVVCCSNSPHSDPRLLSWAHASTRRQPPRARPQQSDRPCVRSQMFALVSLNALLSHLS